MTATPQTPTETIFTTCPLTNFNSDDLQPNQCLFVSDPLTCRHKPDNLEESPGCGLCFNAFSKFLSDHQLDQTELLRSCVEKTQPLPGINFPDELVQQPPSANRNPTTVCNGIPNIHHCGSCVRLVHIQIQIEEFHREQDEDNVDPPAPSYRFRDLFISTIPGLSG